MTRRRAVSAALAVLLLLVLVPLLLRSGCSTEDEPPPPSTEPPARPPPPRVRVEPEPPAPLASTGLPGFAFFPGGPEQPMGMSRQALLDFVDEDLAGDPRRRTNWETVWTRGLLYATPAHRVAVDEFWLARHEVTNAQWRVFLESPRNLVTDTTQVPIEIGALGEHLYDVWDHDPVAHQQAWLSLYYRNVEVLEPVFNKDAVDDFDVLLARAGWEATGASEDALIIPEGTTLTYALIPPPLKRVGFNPDGTIADIVVSENVVDPKTDEVTWVDRVAGTKTRHPAHAISWDDALQYCLWAGLHIPFEREWEHAARGPDGHRFAWGDEWATDRAAFKSSGRYVGALAVDEGEGYESAEGLRHLAGNVNEWVLEPMRLYPGVDDEAPPYDRAGISVLARGGFFGSDSFFMFAADRIWDAGEPLGSRQRVVGFGIRPAGYSLPMKDYAGLVALNLNDTSDTRGPWRWLPPPAFLSQAKRDFPKNWNGNPSKKQQPLVGIAPDLTAGWLERQVQDDSGGDHVYITGPAKGIGFVPAKGMLATGLKSAASLAELAHEAPPTAARERNLEQVCFVGVLIGTANATLHLEDAAGQPVTVSFADRDGDRDNLWARNESVAYRYPIGAFVVLRCDRVAIYPPHGEGVGQLGSHMRAGREPIGYLPEAWAHQWEPLDGFSPSATRDGDTFTLTTAIPPMSENGEPKRNGKGAVLTLHVRATFTDD